MRHIKAVLRRAARWGYLDKAPEIEFVKTPHRLARHIPSDRLQELLNAETHPEYRRMWVFLLWTGCRRSEMLGLCWQDIVWGDKPAAVVTGKGDRQRIVPLLPPVMEALGEPANLGPVFPQHHPATVSKRWKVLARSCGEEDVRLHDLRHTCFTFLASNGVPLKMIQKIAGHSDIRITMGYAEGLIGDLYDEMKKVLD